MNKEPEFELKITGEDLLDHDGIDWIRLVCPHCGADARFNAEHTIMVPGESSYHYGETRHFHTLATCEFCKDLIYIKCFDFDLNPDWHFGYEYHYPKGIAYYSNPTAFDMPVSFFEALTRLQKGDYLATVLICQKILKNLIIENGISEKMTFSSALRKFSLNLRLLDYDEISSLTDNFLLLLNEINLKANDIRNITNEDAKKIYELTNKIVDIVKNQDEIREIQRKMSEIKREKERETVDTIDIDDIPF